MSKSTPETPPTIIQDSTLQGEARGRVKELSGYRKPPVPLSKHSPWEQKFVESSGEIEVVKQAKEIFEKIRSSFRYKRKDLDFSNDVSSATIKTLDFDVNVTLAQHPDAAEEYVLRTEVTAFRNPDIVKDPNFLEIFTHYCDSVVVEFASKVDIKAKIDQIEDVDILADGLDYDPECTEFTLSLPGLGIVLKATSSKMSFSLIGPGDLEKLIENTNKAVARLAGASVTLGLPDSSNY